MDSYPLDWPQVAKIIEVGSGQLTISWCKASYTGYCSEIKRKIHGKAAPVVWEETVQMKDIISDPFELLPSSKLPKCIVDVLRVKHADIFAL